MTAYTVCNVIPHHTLRKIIDVGRHNLRQYSPPEADSARTHLNEILYGPKTGEELALLLAAKIAAAPKAKVKKSSRIAAEFVLGASPEFFRPHNPMAPGQYDAALSKEWADANVAWLVDKYRDNLLSVAAHYDEDTPHLQAIVVPITADGRLSYKDYISDESTDFIKLQTEYAQAMSKFGIMRGIAKSQVIRTDKDEYTRALQHFRSSIPDSPDSPDKNNEKYQISKGFLPWKPETVQKKITDVLALRDEEWEQKTKALAARNVELELRERKIVGLAAQEYLPRIQFNDGQINEMRAAAAAQAATSSTLECEINALRMEVEIAHEVMEQIVARARATEKEAEKIQACASRREQEIKNELQDKYKEGYQSGLKIGEDSTAEKLTPEIQALNNEVLRLQKMIDCAYNDGFNEAADRANTEFDKIEDEIAGLRKALFITEAELEKQTDELEKRQTDLAALTMERNNLQVAVNQISPKDIPIKSILEKMYRAGALNGGYNIKGGPVIVIADQGKWRDQSNPQEGGQGAIELVWYVDEVMGKGRDYHQVVRNLAEIFGDEAALGAHRYFNNIDDLEYITRIRSDYRADLPVTNTDPNKRQSM